MKLVEIRTEEDLQARRSDWESVFARSQSKTIFLSWEWITAWWSAYGTPGDLRILLATDETGAAQGIAPMRSNALRRYGQSAPTLAFIGDGSNDSDYLDCLIATGQE